jgi:hypothetical protein
MQKGNLMKKLTLIILTMLVIAMLCACGGNSTDNNTTPKDTSPSSNTPNTTPTGYLFTYNGVQFGVDMAADAVLTQLGEAKDKHTTESCAFGGEDTVYYYSSIQISTNNELGYERIYSIYLEDDLVATEKGICVGNTADDVRNAYGEPSAKSTDTCLIYEKDSMSLSFNLTDGLVSTILYNDI